jgi:hypothetical protein
VREVRRYGGSSLEQVPVEVLCELEQVSRCVGFNGFSVFFGSFEFFNGFVARFGGFALVLLNSFFFTNLVFDDFVGSSFLIC